MERCALEVCLIGLCVCSRLVAIIPFAFTVQAVVLGVKAALQGRIDGHRVAVMTLRVDKEVGFGIMVHFLDEALVVLVVVDHDDLSEVLFATLNA